MIELNKDDAKRMAEVHQAEMLERYLEKIEAQIQDAVTVGKLSVAVKMSGVKWIDDEIKQDLSEHGYRYYYDKPDKLTVVWR